jgi:hypothetical protein
MIVLDLVIEPDDARHVRSALILSRTRGRDRAGERRWLPRRPPARPSGGCAAQVGLQRGNTALAGAYSRSTPARHRQGRSVGLRLAHAIFD